MLAVSRPQSQTNRSPPATAERSPWQTGQRVLLEMSIAVKSMSLKSQTSSLPLRDLTDVCEELDGFHRLQRADDSRRGAHDSRVPQVNRSLSERFGMRHSRHPVSGGAKTDRFPSIPMAAPKT